MKRADLVAEKRQKKGKNAARQLRREKIIRFTLVGWGMTFMLMTLVFPYQGARGGFFHSSAAFQPLFWSLVPLGLDQVVNWGVQRRSWNPQQPRAVFGITLVVLAALLSAISVFQQVAPGDQAVSAWNQSADKYARIEAFLVTAGARSEDKVMTTNPPGYYLAAGRAAIATPEADLTTLQFVMHRYGARYLILEMHHPDALAEIYQHPIDNDFGFMFLNRIDDAIIYEIGDELP